MCNDVFLILVNGLRRDYLGAYNPKRSCMPTIDGLAAQSAIFTEAVTHSPETTPSAVSLLTGMYPFHTGVRLQQGQSCEAGLPSIATYAKRAGFVTGGFPAVSLLNSTTGLAKGFEYYRDINDGAALQPSGYWQSGDQINEAVDRFLTEAGQRRVFGFIQYADLYQWPLPGDEASKAAYVQAVSDTIDHNCIGGLIEILRRHKRFANAAVILTASPGEPGHRQPLSDGVLRIPLIWRWNKRTANGPRVDRQVRHVDILPTLLQLWGFPSEEWPAPLDGHSLVPLLKGDPLAQAESPWSPSVSYAETAGGAEVQSLRNQQYKFISHADGTQELYDLQTDPSESNDIANDYPRLAEHFAAELYDMTAAAESTPYEDYHDDAEQEVHQRLHALDYMS